jgi:hypothetical protein
MATHTRIVLTDQSGRWFFEDAATAFREGTYWDGNNHVSLATGSQWDHEWLYYTPSGLWVLSRYSGHGNPTTHEEVNEATAIDWLARMDRHDDAGLSALPGEIREAVVAGLASLEM